MRPRILLTNDDGVTSEGLWAAYEALSEFADVTVVAPSSQQSAVGRSISIFEPIRATKIAINGNEAYSVGGKPTDSVIIGLYALKINPDLVVSGINIGENLSFESVMTSGTIGAALEAANHGFPSVAFSLQVEDQGDKFDDPKFSGLDFEDARKVTSEVCRKLLESGFPKKCDVINVNIPKKSSGVYEVTHLADRLFETGVEKRLDPRGRPYFWINGPIFDKADAGTDVCSISKGNISVTPITLDSTAYSGMDEVKNIFNI
ncbi:5'/3'-nucleotidase SurE [Methanomicrobium sp. W14]|uniref:5'/3'-nucleotidase SurE n=1 Tax=Methanomicrobium sp. W14 TaxID=2817839 RepID=UPI001AE167EA